MTEIINKTSVFFQRVIDFVFWFINKFYPYIFCFVCLVISFLCFYNLGEYCVLDWDEARHGVSAYEMIKSGNYIVNTYNLQNDYWNLKPVLSFLPIIISFKIFGASVFSLRFFSALSMVLLSVLSGIFTYKKFGKAESVFTLLTLCGCTPLYIYHCARNGDADSLFILFYSLAIMLAATKNYFFLSGLSLSLGFLTKSFHIGTAVLIIAAYLYITKAYKRLDKKQITLFFTLGISPALLWGICRYFSDGTEFFKNMIERDLLARSSENLESHRGSVFFYTKYLFDSIPMIIVISAVLLAVFIYGKVKSENRKISDITVLFILWFSLPLFLYSLMGTKLNWYIYPVCVPLCIFVGSVAAKTFRSLKINAIIRIGLALFFVYTVCKSTLYFAVRIQHPNTDELQDFLIENVSADSDLPAFIEVKYPEGLEEQSWSQSALFLGKIYGDYNCLSGGIDSFEDCTENGAVLITEKDRYILKTGDSEFENYTVVSLNDTYIMLKK